MARALSIATWKSLLPMRVNVDAEPCSSEVHASSLEHGSARAHKGRKSEELEGPRIAFGPQFTPASSPFQESPDFRLARDPAHEATLAKAMETQNDRPDADLFAGAHRAST